MQNDAERRGRREEIGDEKKDTRVEGSNIIDDPTAMVLGF